MIDVVALSKSEIVHGCIDPYCFSEKCKGKGNPVGGCCTLPKGSIVQTRCHACNGTAEHNWFGTSGEEYEIVRIKPHIPAYVFCGTADKKDLKELSDLFIRMYDERNIK